MRNRLRILAAFLCASMLLTSNASYVLAASVSGNGDMLTDEVVSDGDPTDAGDGGESVPTVTETEEETQKDEQEPSQEPESSDPEDELPGSSQPAQGENGSEEASVEPSSEEPSGSEPSEEATETDSAEETEESSTPAETETESMTEDETETVTETETETETEEFDVSGNDISGNDLSLLTGFQLLAVAPGTMSKYFKVSEGKLELQEGVDKANLPKKITAKDWTSLGDTITEIPAGVLDGESGVEQLEIPKSVTTFAEGAFYGAEHLQYVSFEDNQTGATKLCKRMFSNCDKLLGSEAGAPFRIPSGITEIEEDCFENCSSLLGVKFPSALTKIGVRAFKGCTSMQSAPLDGTEITELGNYSFQNAGITELVFPAGLTKIGNSAFAGCARLGKVDFSKITKLTSFGSSAFLGSGVQYIDFGTGVETIPESAFSGCDKLQGTLKGGSPNPADMLIIGSENQGSGVKTIKTNAFANCVQLKLLQLNASVENVGSGAFVGCSGLKEIDIYNGKGEESTIALAYNAFPSNDKMVVRGYGGTVEEWAGTYKDQGVVYDSLYPAYELEIKYPNGGGSCTWDKKEAKIGETVKLTPKANSGYTLLAVLCGGRTLGADGTFVIQSGDISRDKILIDVIFVKKSGDGATTAGDYTLKATGGSLSIMSNTLRFPNTLMSTRLVIEKDGRATNSSVWSYTVTKKKDCVSIDAEGNIRALKTTGDSPAQITAKLKNTGVQLSLDVYVGAEKKIKEIKEFEFETVTGFKNSTETFTDGESYQMQVLSISQNLVKSALSSKSTKNIGVTVKAVNESDEQIDLAYTWVSGDTGVVKLASSDTSSGTNTLKICGIGTTTVTVTSKLANSDGEKLSKKFIVKVVDKAPHIEAASININPSNSEPVSFRLICVPDTQIETGGSNAPAVVDSKYQEITGLEPDYDDGSKTVSLYLDPDSAYAKKDQTIKNLYLRVFIRDEALPYYVQMPNVVITKKEPKLSVKLTGKINRFLKKEAQGQGEIAVAVTVPSGYVLDGETEPKLEDLSEKEKDKGFADNFEVKKADGDDKKLIITQKAETLENNEANGNKPVLAGYLVLKCEGYAESKIKITIPTENTQPSYVLSLTTLSLNTNAQDQEFQIQLLDKKTKSVIDLDGFTVKVNKPKSSECYWFDMDNMAEVDESGDVIKVKFQGDSSAKLPKSSTLYLDLESSQEWSSAISYKLTVKASSTIPTAKLSAGTITINQSFFEKGTTEISLNQADAELPEVEFETKEKGTKKENADKIQLSYEAGTITASISKEDKPAVGTYSYTVKPRVKYANTETKEWIKTLTIKVQIEEKVPQIKLKSNTFSLNTTVNTGMEQAKQTFTWQYLPKDEDLGVLPALENVTIYDKTNSHEYSVSDAPIKISASQDKDTSTLYFGVELTGKEKISKTTTYEIRDIKIGEAEVNPLTVKVKPITAKPTITLSKKGSINVLDSSTGFIYTVKIKNYAGSIDMAGDSPNAKVFAEFPKSGTDFLTQGMHFKLEPVKEKGEIVPNQFRLFVDPDKAQEIEQRNYKLILRFYVGGKLMNEEKNGTIVEIKPTQTMPKVKVGTTAMNFYMNVKDYAVTTTLEPQKETDAKIKKVVWAKKTSDLVKDAFYQPQFEDGKLTVKIKNPALLKKGSSYSLIFAIQCDNQFAETEGTTFTIKVTMK